MRECLNKLWAQVIVNELVAHGINYFCVSPGSRSTQLILAVSENIKADTFVHFDERALAFHALGYAKGIKKPVAIIVTSGTACGNLLPTIMEAHESGIPLIILTADRPYELQETGANQTTHQHSLFKNFVNWEQSLPAPDSSISLESIKTAISFAVMKSINNNPGPVHLNCMFREPFYLESSSNLETFSHLKPKTTFIPRLSTLSSESFSSIASLFNKAEKGLIILGNDAIDDDGVDFKTLSETLNWPVFADFLSNHPCRQETIYHYNLLCKDLTSQTSIDETFLPDCVIHFGGSFVSKHLLILLNQSKPFCYIHISPKEKRADPLHLVTHKTCISISEFCKGILSYIKPQFPYFLNKWIELNEVTENSLKNLFTKEKKESEPYFFHALSSFNFSEYLFFISNSMPIRDAGDFFHPKNPPKNIFANRGLSGIDGNIATAVGVAKSLSSPMIAIIGDQTFLHDCSSLSQINHLKQPFILIILNNNGGNIFSFLPIYKKKEICISYFIAPHEFQFSFAADLFDLAYIHYTSPEPFLEDFPTLLSTSSHQIIEIQTNREDNLQIHQKIKETLSHVLFSSLR